MTDLFDEIDKEKEELPKINTIAKKVQKQKFRVCQRARLSIRYAMQ